jgi:hypothetical protein
MNFCIRCGASLATSETVCDCCRKPTMTANTNHPESAAQHEPKEVMPDALRTESDIRSAEPDTNTGGAHLTNAQAESAVPHMRETELVAMVTALGYNVTKAESAARQEAEPSHDDQVASTIWKSRYFERRNVIAGWHAKATALGYDGVEELLAMALPCIVTSGGDERVVPHPSPAQSEGASEGGGAEARDAARWRHARQHALGKLLEAYSTPDTCDVGLDYAVDMAIAASTLGEGHE